MFHSRSISLNLASVVRQDAEPERVSEWIRRELEFRPDCTQEKVLDAAGKRVLLNCTRQWGKSTVTAAKAVYQA